jgi:phosphate transport system substrate-binding protein
MMFAFRPALALPAVPLALTLLACGGAGAPASTTDPAAPRPQIIKIDGSSTVYPVTEAVAEDFGRATGNRDVTVGISGTGGGFQKFCRDEIDIADASRPISPSESEACAKTGVQYI